MNRTIYTFTVILLALLGVFYLVLQYGPRQIDDLTVYALPSLKPERGGKPMEIALLRIDRTREGAAPEKLVFERGERGWRLQQPSLRLENEMIERLVFQLRMAHKEESADLSNDLHELGLDHPTVVVTLVRKDDDREFQLRIGKQSAGSNERAVVYVNSSEVPEPMAVPRSQLDEVFRDLREFLPPEMLKASALNTSAVKFERPKPAEPLSLEKRGESRWYYTNPAALGEADGPGEPTPDDLPPGHNTRPLTGVNDLMEAVGAIQIKPKDDIVTLDASDEDLQRYGVQLDRYATLRIEVKRTSDLLVGAAPLKQAVGEGLLIGKRVEDKNQGERYYARREDERLVGTVDAKPIQRILTVLAKPDVLRNRDLVVLDRLKTDAVDIKTSDNLVKLRRCGIPETWRVYGLSQPIEADRKAVGDLLDGIVQRRIIKEFPPQRPNEEFGFDKPAAVVRIWQQGIPQDQARSTKVPPPEPQLQSEPTVELTFGKNEGDLVYVRRQEGKEQRVFEVPASLVAKIVRAPINFANKTLPSFLTVDAVKLELTRDGKTFVLENDAKEPTAPANWKVTSPADSAGKADGRNVFDILAELSRLQPVELVAGKEADLAAFGLKDPKFRAVVTLRKGSQKMTYTFGKETEDKKGVFAKHSDRDLVFVAPLTVVGPLGTDLSDRTIFNFDPVNVQEMKLTGWPKLAPANGMLTLWLKNTDRGWVVKEAPTKEFVLDSEPVNFLVNSRLSRLSAEKNLAGGPKGPYELDDARYGLRIELMIKGKKTPRSLTIGALDAAAKGYYSQASTRPGQVFLLPQRAFEEILKEGPGYFKKKAEPEKKD